MKRALPPSLSQAQHSPQRGPCTQLQRGWMRPWPTRRSADLSAEPSCSRAPAAGRAGAAGTAWTFVTVAGSRRGWQRTSIAVQGAPTVGQRGRGGGTRSSQAHQCHGLCCPWLPTTGVGSLSDASVWQILLLPGQGKLSLTSEQCISTCLEIPPHEKKS